MYEESLELEPGGIAWLGVLLAEGLVELAAWLGGVCRYGDSMSALGVMLGIERGGLACSCRSNRGEMEGLSGMREFCALLIPLRTLSNCGEVGRTEKSVRVCVSSSSSAIRGGRGARGG